MILLKYAFENFVINNLIKLNKFIIKNKPKKILDKIYKYSKNIDSELLWGQYSKVRSEEKEMALSNILKSMNNKIGIDDA